MSDGPAGNYPVGQYSALSEQGCCILRTSPDLMNNCVLKHVRQTLSEVHGCVDNS